MTGPDLTVPDLTGPAGDRAIRLAIVDDDPLVRVGLAMLPRGAGGIELVAEATDGAEVDAMVDAHRPDVILMDIRMPRVDGLTATRRVRARPSAPQVIVLTTFDSDEHVLQALRAGASGFLLKDTPPPEIVQAVRRVAAGEPMLSPSVTRRLIDHVTDPVAGTRRERAQRLLDQLTERELEVAVAIAQGRANAEIGAELFLSVATVKVYVSRMLTKLDLNNRVQIALLVHDADLA
jgi:DNA-binding NarL/FixJ family response regulator